MRFFQTYKRLCAAAAALAAVGTVQAGAVSVMVAPGSYAPGSTVSVQLQDSKPSDMCSAGLCAADILLSFDPQLLSFAGVGGGSTLPAALGLTVLPGIQTPGGALGAMLALSLVAVEDTSDPDPVNHVLMPSTSSTLLSLDFTVLSGAGGQAVVMAEPDQGVAVPSYSFSAASSPAVTILPGTGPQPVPEPGGLPLVALALGLAALTAARARR